MPRIKTEEDYKQKDAKGTNVTVNLPLSDKAAIAQSVAAVVESVVSYISEREKTKQSWVLYEETRIKIEQAEKEMNCKLKVFCEYLQSKQIQGNEMLKLIEPIRKHMDMILDLLSGSDGCRLDRLTDIYTRLIDNYGRMVVAYSGNRLLDNDEIELLHKAIQKPEIVQYFDEK